MDVKPPLLPRGSEMIVGVENHDVYEHDSKTLKAALALADENRKMPVLTAVIDRGYKGCKRKVEVEVILPSTQLKQDNEKTGQRKRKLCQKRSAIEPVIGHLKHDYRLSRNCLKGDKINLLMAVCAWKYAREASLMRAAY